METTTKPARGRPKLPDEEKGQQICLRLKPSLITRLERIADGRTWPALLQMLADRWEGLR